MLLLMSSLYTDQDNNKYVWCCWYGIVPHITGQWVKISTMLKRTVFCLSGTILSHKDAQKNYDGWVLYVAATSYPQLAPQLSGHSYMGFIVSLGREIDNARDVLSTHQLGGNQSQVSTTYTNLESSSTKWQPSYPVTPLLLRAKRQRCWLQNWSIEKLHRYTKFTRPSEIE